MAKISPVSIKYMIHASFRVEGALEKALLEDGRIEDGDIALIVADKDAEVAATACGRLRRHLGIEQGLASDDDFAALWVVDFPMFEKDKERKIATVTLNRPEKLNPITGAMFDKIDELIEAVNMDDEVKVLIFKGAGRAFSSGADVAELGVVHGNVPGKRPSQRNRLLLDTHLMGPQGGFAAILNCRKSTIAQVHGYCYGGGLNISNACDVTIAASNTLFTHPGYTYIGPTTDLWLLTQLVGLKKAKEMTLSGIPVDAQEALQIGLVNKVVPLEKLEEETTKMAEAMSRMPIDGIVMGKINFEAVHEAMGQGNGYIANSIMHAMQTAIHYEPGEYNLLKERRDKGVTGAIMARKEYYKEKV